MKIKYKGHSCFVIYGKDFSLCLDPYDNIGLTPINCKADYYFCSHNHYDHNNWKLSQGKPFNDGEVLLTYHDNQKGKLRGENKVLLARIDGVKFAHLGDLGEENDAIIDFLQGVDILMIPIGGNYTINAKQAKSYIDKINPKIVIPMHYRIKGSLVDIDTIDCFLSLNDYPYEKISELDISAKSLTKQTQIYELIAEVI